MCKARSPSDRLVARVVYDATPQCMLHQDIEKLPALPGFRFGACAAGIKSNGKQDVAIIAVDGGTSSFAGVFTKNRVVAAPVTISRKHLKSKDIFGILVNSGNANACTGKAGMAAAMQATQAFAQALGTKAANVLPASTGVIGQVLPAEKIVRALPELVRGASARRAKDFALGIMTTDLFPKVAVAEVKLGRTKLGTVMGLAKGAGMIHPNMATTLGFVVTDLHVKKAVLQRALKMAADETFNAISVDGDTSTNDTLIALGANVKLAKVRIDGKDAAQLQAFQTALTSVLEALSESIVRDGEGAEHVVRFSVIGLPTNANARKVAETIATSPLVKTALHGVDANWGRILAAAGRAGIAFDPTTAQIDVVPPGGNGVTIVKNGAPVGAKAEKSAQAIMKLPRYDIVVSLGRGRGKAHYTTCDMGKSYIAVNANYRS